MTWKVTAQRYVTFIDIMGFKELVARSSHKQVLRIMGSVAATIKGMEQVERRNLKRGGKKFDAPGTVVLPAVFSDSILLCTNTDKAEALTNLVWATDYLLNDLLKQGIPAKGAVAHGEFTFDHDNSIYFGKPLIDAYLLQDELQLYAVAAHHTAERRILSDQYLSRHVHRHKTPLKSGAAYHHLLKMHTADSLSITHDGALALYSSVSGRPRTYVDNTMEFFDEIGKFAPQTKNAPA